VEKDVKSKVAKTWPSMAKIYNLVLIPSEAGVRQFTSNLPPKTHHGVTYTPQYLKLLLLKCTLQGYMYIFE